MAATGAEKSFPDALRQDTRTTQIIRDRIWKPPNRENNWSAFVMVGREGSGKSLTTARILDDTDPTFDADRVFFDPIELIRFISELEKDERRGKAVMLDESGVEMGVRSWYEQSQIKVNKAFQTLRDDNMIIGLTLPSFSLLDSQLRTRLHGFCEMRQVVAGEYAVWSWKDIHVDRTENGTEIKRKTFPRVQEGRRRTKIKRLKIGPPADSFVEPYEEQKEIFKQQYLEGVVREDDAEEEDDLGPKELAQRIIDNDNISEYTSVHGGRGTRYVDKDKLFMEFEHLTHRDAKMLKKLLMESWGDA